MTTIEITDIADVQDGDIVTLRWKEEPGITVTLEGPAQDSTVGDFRITRGRFVSATRQAPEWEPGTAGTATVGPKRRQTRAYSVGEGALVEAVGGGYAVWKADDVHSFVPDDAEALRAEVERLRASMDANTHLLISRGGTVWHRGDLCGGAPRTVPTREQAVAAIEKRLSWASIHWGVEHLHPDALPEIADTVLALIEQGGA